eukprot:444528_1
MAGMASVQETSVETEGSDHLQAFFNQNSKLKPQWLDKIRQELDYDDLLESDGTDLRNILKNDCELKGPDSSRYMRVVVSEKCVHIVGFDWNDDQFENCNNLSEVEYELVKSPEPEDIESSEEDLVTKMISRRMKLYPGD